MLVQCFPSPHRATAVSDREPRYRGEGGIETETTRALERHVNKAVGDPGELGDPRLTSPALPLARVMAVGEERRLPLEC